MLFRRWRRRRRMWMAIALLMLLLILGLGLRSCGRARLWRGDAGEPGRHALLIEIPACQGQEARG